MYWFTAGVSKLFVWGPHTYY